MSALRAALSGVRRALSRLWPTTRPATPVALSPDELELSLQHIDAMRLDHWMERVAPLGHDPYDQRMSEYDLKHLRESTALRGAPARIAQHLDAREAASCAAQLRSTDAATALAQHSMDALARHEDSRLVLTALIQRNRAAVIARHVATLHLRPVSPRAPALARLS